MVMEAIGKCFFSTGEKCPDYLSSNLITVDPASGTRSYAGTAYYQPNANRSNLTILPEAQVHKIIFSHQEGEIVASGVDFTSYGTKYHVKAEHEVLLCAGSIQSPQLLELSGIGSRNVLEPLGIKVVVENANIGENFQDHGIVPLCFQAADGVTTFDSFGIAGVEAAATTQFYGSQTGLLSSLIDSNANLSYQQVDQRIGHVSSTPISELTNAATNNAAPILKKQYKLLGEALLNPKDSAYQMIYIPVGVQKGFADGEGTPSPGNFITLYASVARPYSRGSVHITSKDPTVAPIIDPNYLSHPLDVELFSDGVLFLQYLATKEPFASLLKDGGKAFHPGFEHLTKEMAGEFCREALTSEYHPIGTCSMMPESEGGVVDTKLKLYGVANLRVIDASIFPLEIRNNLQTSVYAVAEKAADIIKSDWKEAKGIKNGTKRGASPEVKKGGKRARRC
jgi:choline dehydrogenase-like flavoprotein